MRYLLYALTFAACMSPMISSGNEQLRPEDSQFTRASIPPGATLLAPYHAMIIEVLHDAFAQDVRARLVAMPSYTPEYALGIKETDGTFKIFHLASQAQLWSYENLRMLRDLEDAGGFPGQAENLANAIAEYDAELPDDYQDVQTSYCEIDIPAPLARDLLTIWEKLLLETRYGGQAPLGPDGTDYHFSMRASGLSMSGKTWEPDPESKTGAMVSITETMRSLCLTADRNLIGQLEPQIAAMLTRFAP